MNKLVVGAGFKVNSVLGWELPKRLLVPKALFVLLDEVLNRDDVFAPVPVLNKLVEDVFALVPVLNKFVVGAGFRLNPVLG